MTRSISWGLGALLSAALLACDPAAAARVGAATPAAASAGAGACGEVEVGAALASDPLERWAEAAVSGTAAEREAAVKGLRAAGPRGLAAFVRHHGDALAPAAGEPVAGVIAAAVIAAPPTVAGEDAAGGPLVGLWRALRGVSGGAGGSELAAASTRAAAIDAAIDAICRQDGCRATQLYWFTDLEAAKIEARASGRPILSLRLLGDLGEALSCANSRLFRTILYPALASTLRERFVLHWSSERPAPVITIDFGDGRTLTRTITGNSVHVILDAEGRPVDALPGLLPPAVFERLAERAAALALTSQGLSGGEREALIREHHRQRLAELEVAWAADLRAIGVDPLEMALGSRRPGIRLLPSAGEAMPIAASKMRIEAPILGGLGLAERGAQWPAIWERLGGRHRPEARLPSASLRAMRALEVVDAAMIDASEASLAVDGVRNEYELHREIHRWFAAGEVGELAALQRRIYDDLFLTPASDPTLGMAPPEVFSGLPRGGWVRPR